MQIVHKRPPNWDAITKVFKVEGQDVCFTWGELLYVPTRFEVPVWLMRHEMIHAQQQHAIGIEPWWDRYLAEPAFRLEQEIPAHIEEYKTWCDHYAARLERKYRRQALHVLASRLSGPLYNRMIRYEEARRVLKQAVAS